MEAAIIPSVLIIVLDAKRSCAVKISESMVRGGRA